MEHFLLQCPGFPSQHTALRSWLFALAIIKLDMPTHLPGSLTRPSLLVTCCPSLYLCLFEEDRPAITPGIHTQDCPRAHKDP
ncbi:hypothetical protein E2C01_069336 [Portunus trituberculatus]|uniref:Uncharacterized protein n=1 Tax=Portunus trituberculatus TaxID=210409 RepID=A0A5B7HY96_PORTR|nr:hypothetical protein [Portunus trituberculatus]